MNCEQNKIIQMRKYLPTKVNKRTRNKKIVHWQLSHFVHSIMVCFETGDEKLLLMIMNEMTKRKMCVKSTDLAYHVWETVSFGPFLWWTVAFDAKRLVTLRLHLNLVLVYVHKYADNVEILSWNMPPSSLPPSSPLLLLMVLLSPLSPFAAAVFSNIFYPTEKWVCACVWFLAMCPLFDVISIHSLYLLSLYFCCCCFLFSPSKLSMFTTECITIYSSYEMISTSSHYMISFDLIDSNHFWWIWTNIPYW